MSGVFGIADAAGKMDIPAAIKKMSNSMRHWDWTVSEYEAALNNRCAVGRNGIGVFNRAPQPVWNADRSVALVMAGEFYNTRALGKQDASQTDEAFALDLYEEIGEEFSARLEGIFVIAILDQRQQRLVITNDRFGLYPLYYAHVNGVLAFAPEMKGVLSMPGLQRKLDMTALAEYMRFQFLLGDKTFFESVTLLPIASVLVYGLQDDSLKLHPYWDFSKIPELHGAISFDEAVEEAGRLLDCAVQKRTQRNERLGIYLSAGMDSRLLLGLARQEHKPIRTITYGTRDSRDVVYARQLAKIARSDHRYFEFTNGAWVQEYVDQHLELTEGFHSWIHSHGISILDQVRTLIDINLSGFGGGEIDYEDEALLMAPDEIAFTTRMFHHATQNTTWPSLDEAEERSLYAPRLASKMVGLAFESFVTELKRYQNLPFERRAIAFARINPVRRLFQYYTVFHRSCMEQRIPFYDYQYIDFIHSIPYKMLFKRKLRRSVILKFTPAYARVPNDKDNIPILTGEIPNLLASITERTKRYFNRHITRLFPDYKTLNSDYESWLRGELRAWAESVLFEPRTTQAGFFNEDFLLSLWKRCQSEMETNIIGKIAPIMTWEMLRRRFCEEEAK